MLATLVIGLREGLEAALIVGIIAAFLRRNGQQLKAMWVGVILAVLLSVGVGVGLEFVSASLPQAQQEGMESIIGAVAVVFVTGMIVWMNTHARGMRRELESSATTALRNGATWALAGMAFLAVLKEGFETSVFLLATFQASEDTALAVLGTLVGILIAVGIGIAIYHGGLRLNLGRFFKVTGIFLVFVAAGLVVSMLRTAYAAGWFTFGQQKTVDLTWLTPNGSIQSALLTGVLGIPADPRVIEVLGWLLYLIPMLLYCLWPARHRPTPENAQTVKLSIAAGLGAVALILAIAIPAAPALATPAAAPLTGGGTATLVTDASSARLIVQRDSVRQTAVFSASERSSATRDGVAAVRWEHTQTGSPATNPASITLTELLGFQNGRLPVGVNAQANPGPFKASWVQNVTQTVWSVDGRMLDATSTAQTTLTISGGGLTSPRTFSVAPGAQSTDELNNWSVSPGHVSAAVAAANAAAASVGEVLLWKLYLPLALLVAALLLTASALVRRRRLHKAAVATALRAAHAAASDPTSTRSTSYAAQS
ncbi:iron uptake transporter permease EfeU [Rathayibacter soli]|uniref:iron uptake transporter permease EfeU n=1 Tax=Rathayibacter soli TaxID=3144168 RepID=UPI0027E5836B|nr:iron uptake transporter permease EfeU [Glaciibacter superstes]